MCPKPSQGTPKIPQKSTLDPLGTLPGYPSPPKAPQGTLRISKVHPKAIQSTQMDAKTMPPAPKVTKKTSNIMQPPVSRKGPAAGGEALKIFAAPLQGEQGVMELTAYSNLRKRARVS